MSTATLPLAEWGAAGARFVHAADGARVDYECAQARAIEPISIDAEGRFAVAARYEAFGAGPAPSRIVPARIEGRETGSTIILTVRPQGMAPIRHELTRGLRVKLIRCL